MKTAKQELSEVLERMPDDAPMETLLAEVRFRASVLRGLADLANGDVVSHEEVKETLNRWRESSGRKKVSET